jgi:hypothetical protein
MKTPAITQDPDAWMRGYRAGLAGDAAAPPPGIDALSYVSGRIEGQAARGQKVTRLPLKPKPQPR